MLGGVPQVIFGAGDGYVYSFLGTAENDDGRPKLLWKFDCNPKESKYVLGGRADRNHIIGTPVIYKGLVYVAVGEDPEHGEGIGHFWCIDPTKRGDVSPELAFNVKDLKHPIPIRRNQAVIKELGEVARPNPNSAAVWQYSTYDLNGDGKIGFDETMHRTIGTATIKNDLLYIADYSGILHCLDAKTGKPHWGYDLLSDCWASALIVDDKVYIGNEDGDDLHLQALAEDGAGFQKVGRHAGRREHGRRDLLDRHRCPRRAIHLDEEPALRDPSPQGRREVRPPSCPSPAIGAGELWPNDSSLAAGFPIRRPRCFAGISVPVCFHG